MKQILKLSIVTIIEVLLLGFGGNSSFGELLLVGNVFDNWTFWLMSGLLLLLNLLPLVAHHRKYGLHYVVLLLFLLVLFYPQAQYSLWFTLLFPFSLVPVLIANTGYLYLSEECRDRMAFFIALFVACAGMELFSFLNYYVLSDTIPSGEEVKSAGWNKYGYLLFLSYFFGSVIQNLLLWHNVRRAALFSGLFALIILSIGVFLARRYPIWIAEGIVGALVTIGGQYLIVRCLRRSYDREVQIHPVAEHKIA